jgi:hypothetical protein
VTIPTPWDCCNRYYPKLARLARAVWLAEPQAELLLSVPHFHVVLIRPRQQPRLPSAPAVHIFLVPGGGLSFDGTRLVFWRSGSFIMQTVQKLGCSTSRYDYRTIVKP